MSEIKEVVVTDIKMTFESMVTFIIKWFFATLIAGIVLAFIIGGVVLLLGLMGFSLDRIF